VSGRDESDSRQKIGNVSSSLAAFPLHQLPNDLCLPPSSPTDEDPWLQSLGGKLGYKQPVQQDRMCVQMFRLATTSSKTCVGVCVG